jgi:hypothetical protein
LARASHELVQDGIKYLTKLPERLDRNDHVTAGPQNSRNFPQWFLDLRQPWKDTERDNVFVERLWRSVKDEEVYLRAYDSVSAARASLPGLLQQPRTAFEP